MIARYRINDSKNEIKLYLVLIPILMLLIGLSFGLMIGASAEQPLMSLTLSLLWTAAVPVIAIGYLIHKIFQKIDIL